MFYSILKRKVDLITQTLQELQHKLKDTFKSEYFKFDADSHTYTYKGKKLVSVTTFLKKFYREFDSAYWSRKKAIDRLIENGQEVNDEAILETKTEILEEWQNKADVACDMGTLVHEYIEQKYNPYLEISECDNEEANKRISKFEAKLSHRLKDLVSIAQELRIFSTTLGLAGTIDALFLRDGILYILDWKTNGKLRTDSDRNYSKMFPPFASEWENEFNKYSIQLNLYKLMLAEYGIYVQHCVIVYIPPSNEEPKIMKCKNYITQLETYFGVNYYTKLEKTEYKN